MHLNHGAWISKNSELRDIEGGYKVMTWSAYYWTSDGKLETLAEGEEGPPPGQEKRSYRDKPDLRVQMWDESTQDFIDRPPPPPLRDVVVETISDSRLDFIPPQYKITIAAVMAEKLGDEGRYR